MPFPIAIVNFVDFYRIKYNNTSYETQFRLIVVLIKIVLRLWNVVKHEFLMMCDFFEVYFLLLMTTKTSIPITLIISDMSLYIA